MHASHGNSSDAVKMSVVQNKVLKRMYLHRKSYFNVLI